MTQSTSPTPSPQPADTVTLTIDGKTVTARKGTLLVEAAKLVGIEIPVFCYHPKMKPVGACRMCLVQIEKMPRLQTACTTPVGQDMVVHTRSKEAIEGQNGVIEFLLENHPLDCPVCDKGGECPLQDNTFAYGAGISRFTEQKRHKEKAYPLGERIVLDRERCIMCYRCVRFHQEIAGDEELAALQRGADTEIGTLPGQVYDSIFSGNTIELCPVGALTSRQYRFKARPWDLVRTASVCNGCAVGCNLEIHSRAERVLRLVARENPAVDDGWLCDLGRFDTVPADRSLRPPRPLVRSASGALEMTSWETALARATDLVRPGAGQSAALLASADLSNEALWLLETALAPALADAGQVAIWPPIGGQWPVQGAIANLARCKVIVAVGLDVWSQLPILALWIRKAALQGATFVVVNPTNEQRHDTTAWLRTTPGQEVAVARALQARLSGQLAVEAGGVSAADLEHVAARLMDAETPAALLVHPALVASAEGRALFEELAASLRADGENGLVGAPGLAANARGAQELAPTVAAADTTRLLGDLAEGRVSSLLVLGNEDWSELPTGSARLVLATAGRIVDDPRVDVVLPLAHPYERQGSLTNLEGRIQIQDGGATPPIGARADWGLVAELARALGATAPERLSEVRAAMAETSPSFGRALDVQAEALLHA